MKNRRSEYVVGWIDTSIHEFLASIDRPPASMKYALLTSLDSSFDLPALLDSSKHLESLRGRFEKRGRGLVISTHHLVEADRQSRLFFGFDEVWFFPTKRFPAKPDDLVIVGPHPLNERTLERWQDWLSASGCSLALGDGTGMSFILKAQGIGKHVVRAFVDAHSA